MPPRESQRRGQILDGAVEVLGELGLRGFTHRAIDAHAALPAGTTSAYFRTRLALLTGVAEHVAARMNEEMAVLTDAIKQSPDDHELAAAQVLSMIDGWFEHPSRTAATLELRLAGRREPILREVLGPWHQHWIAAVEELVALGGHDDARLRAETIVAGVQGVVVEWLDAETDDRHERSARAIRMLLASVLAD